MMVVPKINFVRQLLFPSCTYTAHYPDDAHGLYLRYCHGLRNQIMTDLHFTGIRKYFSNGCVLFFRN